MIAEYFKWHYGRGFGEFIDQCRVLAFFIAHYFSFNLLSRTLFSPWKRMSEQYNQGLHLESLVSTLIVNTLMRAVGFVVRAVILVIGLTAFVLFVFLAFVSAILWLFMPAVIGLLILSAFLLIYSSI